VETVDVTGWRVLVPFRARQFDLGLLLYSHELRVQRSRVVVSGKDQRTQTLQLFQTRDDDGM
jgi:hypothetical protein